MSVVAKLNDSVSPAQPPLRQVAMTVPEPPSRPPSVTSNV